MGYFNLDRDTARLILLQRTETITPKLKNLRKIFGRYIFTNFVSKYLISPKSIGAKYYEVMHQEMEQLKYYEEMITRHRDDGLRPYRATTQINWDKAVTEWHSTLNQNQGE